MSIGYLELLEQNPRYRRLWLAEVVSYLGDWFNTIALYAAVEKLSSSAQAVTVVFVAKMLPVFFMTPVAGPLIDRFDRKKILVATDVARALCALGLVMAYRVESLELLIGIVVVMVCFSGIFIPSRASVLPQLTSTAELGAANALSAGTWSVMLALGAALGGLVTGLVGIELSLVVDALTFLLSAALLVPLPPLMPTADDGSAQQDKSFRAGLRYLRREPYLAAILSLKPLMGLSGGALAMLPIFGTRIFPETRGPLYIGLLYACRGLGALVGSLVVRRIFGDRPRTMRRFILPAFVVLGSCNVALAGAPTIWHAALAYFGASVGNGTLWTFSSTLGQQQSDNAYRGRVFSMEWGAFTLSMSGVATLSGVLVDAHGWTVQHVAAVSGAMMFLPLVLWAATLVVLRHRLEGERA